MLAYTWPKPGHDAAVDKVSYVALFKPWDGVLGTGMYIDDINAQFRKYLTQMALLGLVIALVLATFISLIVRSISRPSGKQSKPWPISPVAKAT